MTDEQRPESRSVGADSTESGPVKTPSKRNTSGLKPPWPKGVSGNPGGRPKGKREFSEACREVADEARGVLEEVMRKTDATDRSRIAAALALIEHAYGKPDVTVQTPAGGPVYIIAQDEATQIDEGLNESV